MEVKVFDCGIEDIGSKGIDAYKEYIVVYKGDIRYNTGRLFGGKVVKEFGTSLERKHAILFANALVGNNNDIVLECDDCGGQIDGTKNCSGGYTCITVYKCKECQENDFKVGDEVYYFNTYLKDIPVLRRGNIASIKTTLEKTKYSFRKVYSHRPRVESSLAVFRTPEAARASIKLVSNGDENE